MHDAAPEGRLTVIGSGTLLPSSARSSPAYHVEVSGGPESDAPGARIVSVLLDCGSGTLHALARHGIEWESIDTLAISHYHADHVGDLVALLGAWRFQGRERPLTLLGPSDIDGFLERLASVYGGWVLEPGFPIRIVALGPSGSWSDEQGVLRIDGSPTPHTETSVSFRVAGAWGTLGYTGDTSPSDTLARFLVGCDVLVAECALTDPPEFDGHLTPLSLGELCSTARPGLLLVTHVYPPTSPETMVELVRDQWGGNVEAAHDGMSVLITRRHVNVDRPARGE